ncbi:islet amyloid polypeptide [Cinclus cinclus]|uniref:islet amyloid polypeptide n=1 Tax=Cinclus cinclus TaxID=127875 RepID=UPI002E14FEBC
MCNLKLSLFFIALSVTLSCLEATPIESHQLEKRKCNTATCVTQRLADFLVRSSSSIGAIYSPTNVGSNTYGKRDTAGLVSREPQNHAQL